MSSSHLQTEQALDRLLQNFQNGAGDDKSKTAIAAISEESMDVAWPQLLDALEDCGLDKTTATEHHLFIVDWLVGAMMDGLLPVDGILETDSSSNYSTSDSDPPTPVEFATSSDSEPDEYPVILDDDYLYNKLPESQPAWEDLRYIEPFGSLGRYIAKEVRSSPEDTFKEDLNRARQYWKRGDWDNVKKHLLRALVAAHRPHHRQSDLSPRCATYLLGIAYSNSGDLERAKRIMFTVLTPFDINNTETAPCDDAQIAAATWLGDLCLKTNKTESAALAWSIAYDAANLRSTYLSQGYPPSHSDSSSESETWSFSSSEGSPPPPLGLNSRRPTSLSRTFRAARAQSMAILNRLESVNRKIRHLDALIESLNLGWDPDSGTAIFSEHRLLTMGQMQRVSQKARAAIDTAIELVQINSRMPRPPVEPEDPKDDSKPLPAPPPRQAIVQVPRERQSVDDILALLTTAEDCLQTPVRSNEWPLAYDIRFSRTAVVKTINWVYSFTPLDFEGVMSGVPSLDVRQYREIHPRSGRPLYVSEKLDPRRPEDGAKFLSTVKRMLDSLHIEYLDEPGTLRCRSRTDGANRWPSIACFSLRVIRYKTDGFMRGIKFAVYVKDVLHWNGQKEEMIQDHSHTRRLIQDMAATLQNYELEERKTSPPLPPALTINTKSIRSASYLPLPKLNTAKLAPVRKPIQISNPQVLVNSTAF